MHLVVFDIDGTLTDTNAVDGECYWRAVREVLGVIGEQPAWDSFPHVTDAGIAAELCLRRLGREISREECAAIGNRLAALLEVALVKDPAQYRIPGASEILSILGSSPGFAIALATGGMRVSAELKLRRAGIAFSALPFASSSDAFSREDILRIAASRAAEKHAAQFSSFSYVGDGVWDVKTAQQLGWRFIGIGAGENADRLRAAGAKIIVRDYRPAESFLQLLKSG
jgi:phosphoglycolate phosphatase-like HAD superfamily hydrolase